MGGIDLCVLDGCLVHEVLTDGDGSVFEIISIGKDPVVLHGRFIYVAVHGERVLDVFWVVEEAGGCASYQ